MKTLDSRTLALLLQKASTYLSGEWLLVGGTLLPAVGLDVRTTVDVDLIGLGETESAQILQLMEISEGLGLSVDTINQAAAYFVKKVGYKKSDLLPLIKGSGAVIYRPSVELYWRLKLGRMSESDLLDCQHYLHYCLGQNDSVSLSKLRASVETASKVSTVPEQGARHETLIRILEKLERI